MDPTARTTTRECKNLENPTKHEINSKNNVEKKEFGRGFWTLIPKRLMKKKSF